jgi:anti-sigma regulatory factor (Ser/Thr protein kinase)
MRATTLTIRNDLAEFKRVTPRVISFLTASDVPGKAAYSARVAVEELLVNIIQYAYDDGDEHEITLELRVDDEHIVVTVEDDGRPFDPRGVEAPDLSGSIEDRRAGGWGIHLVRLMSDDISYQRKQGRNRVQVQISLQPAPS